MKKLLLAALALAVVAFAPTKSTEITTEHEIHLHRHAEAAPKNVTWQCRNCGQTSWLRPGTLPASYGCDGDFTKRHVWERLD